MTKIYTSVGSARDYISKRMIWEATKNKSEIVERWDDIPTK